MHCPSLLFRSPGGREGHLSVKPDPWHRHFPILSVHSRGGDECLWSWGLLGPFRPPRRDPTQPCACSPWVAWVRAHSFIHSFILPGFWEGGF